MRLLIPAVLLLASCATLNARPTTVFPPMPEEAPAPGSGDQATVWVLEHKVVPHDGCYAVQRTNGAGIIRCGFGQVEWLLSEGVGQGVDDYDILRDAMKDDAAKENAALDDKELNCTLGGAPGSCHAFAFTPKDGSPGRVTIVGIAQLQGRALVSQCVAKAGQTDSMKPVCGEVFELK